MVKEKIAVADPQKTKKSKERTTQVQSLVRALHIMNVLAEEETGVTLTGIARRVEIPISTTHRLLTTLQQERFVRFENEHNYWFIGAQCFMVGSAFVRSRDLVSISRPYMRRLMEESNETVNLAVEEQGEAVYLAQVECRELMRAIARPGGRVALHSSGVGKALLSAMAEKEIEAIIAKHGMARATDRTIGKPGALQNEMENIRNSGYAFDNEEHAIGLRCIASVIHDEFGRPMAAISVSGPRARITDGRIKGLGALVKRAAAEITTEIGGRAAE
jgi:IclR family acetate operon transcriptional repressor